MRGRAFRLAAAAVQNPHLPSVHGAKFPVKLMKSVHREYFVAPSHDESKPGNLWSLENSFATVFKELAPVRHYEMTAHLGKFLAPHGRAF